MRLLLPLLAAAGCSFSGATPGGSGSDGGENRDASDSGLPDAAIVSPAECAAPGVIRDDLDAIDPFWIRAEPSAGSQIQYANGALALTIADTQQFIGLIGKGYLDFRGGDASIEVLSVPSGGPVLQIAFEFEVGRSFGLEVGPAGLYATVSEMGMPVSVSTPVAFDSAVHRFLRVREANGTLYFYSRGSNASAWVEFHRAETPLFAGVVRPILAIANPGGSPSSSAGLDNFNVDAPTSQWCSVTALSGLGGPLASSEWKAEKFDAQGDSSCNAVHNSIAGTAAISHTQTSKDCVAQVQTRRLYHLANGEGVSVELSAETVVVGTSAALEIIGNALRSDGDPRFSVFIDTSGNQVCGLARVGNNSTPLCALLTDQTRIGIAIDGGDVVFTAGTAGAMSEINRVTADTSMPFVITVSVESFVAAATTTGTVTFSNFTVDAAQQRGSVKLQ